MNALSSLMAVVITLAGCATTAGEKGSTVAGSGSSGGGSCALIARFHGQRYLGYQPTVVPEPSEPIGIARVPACGNEDDPWTIEVGALPGVDPELAVAETDGERILIAEGIKRIPTEVQRYLETPACGHGDRSVTLRGPWLGILGADGNTEVDLIPPYDLEMLVEESTLEAYEGANLTIRAPSSLGEPITREDVRTALWKAGDLQVEVTCSGRGFVAERVEVIPGT